MKLFRLFITLALSLSVLTTTVQAADTAPWYDVELILFKQGPTGSGASENWPGDPGSPDWTGAVTLQPQSAAGQSYALLPRSAWRLNAHYNTLRRSRNGFEPLFHQAWRQQVATSRSAKSIYLGPDRTRSEGTPPPPFEGLIKISVSRYLHVDLDILLRGANGNHPLNTPDLLASPSRGSIRFQAKRRMRSDELHYIDHPKMGALIMISRARIPQPPAAQESPATDSEPASAESEPQEPEKPAPAAAAN
ncbi:peptidoglycan binding protein CsiV [Sedimenticola thiotaurini]|uniref:Peptidoglycan-binding protein CsiV n=1 Tax=Sedimenticola thiotaurini TaxID=1543721 RepID=A0A0F7JY81_9GAMM|nr:peptidoglycan binding protein CsiV [Sedimenticola thiotaurini]AKH19830.1 hypothetical protein AAY24_05070 [Sedimenticola thiotaurini]